MMKPIRANTAHATFTSCGIPLFIICKGSPSSDNSRQQLPVSSALAYYSVEIPASLTILLSVVLFFRSQMYVAVKPHVLWMWLCHVSVAEAFLHQRPLRNLQSFLYFTSVENSVCGHRFVALIFIKKKSETCQWHCFSSLGTCLWQVCQLRLLNLHIKIYNEGRVEITRRFINTRCKYKVP